MTRGRWTPSNAEVLVIYQDSSGNWYTSVGGGRTWIPLSTMRQIAALCGDGIPDLVEGAEEQRQAYYREYAEEHRRLAAEDEAKMAEPPPIPQEGS